ncbi:hypothetical protein ACR6C2_42825 [Streptomyces sp. INA 01156]
MKVTDPYGRHWVIQCKHRRSGLAWLCRGHAGPQVLNGTARSVRGADIAVIVTKIGSPHQPSPSPHSSASTWSTALS